MAVALIGISLSFEGATTLANDARPPSTQRDYWARPIPTQEVPAVSSVARGSIKLSVDTTAQIQTVAAQGIVGATTTIEARLRESGAPGEIRTPDPLVRSQVLYPTELRAHCEERATIQQQARRAKPGWARLELAEREGFEPSKGF